MRRLQKHRTTNGKPALPYIAGVSGWRLHYIANEIRICSMLLWQHNSCFKLEDQKSDTPSVISAPIRCQPRKFPASEGH